MFRAEVEPMPESTRTTAVYRTMEGCNLRRRTAGKDDREHITHSMATKIAREMNFQFGRKRTAKGA
jgi:hypothetical protein